MISILKSIVTIIIVVFFTSISLSQDYKTSAGLRLGTSIAVSSKTFLTEKKAVEAIVGITRDGGNSLLTVGGFYKVHNKLTNDIPALNWYLGAGGFFKLGNEDIKTNILISLVIGLEYTFDSSPINIFIDGSPYFNAIQDVGFDANASLGVRYVF